MGLKSKLAAKRLANMRGVFRLRQRLIKRTAGRRPTSPGGRFCNTAISPEVSSLALSLAAQRKQTPSRSGDALNA